MKHILIILILSICAIGCEQGPDGTAKNLPTGTKVLSHTGNDSYLIEVPVEGKTYKYIIRTGYDRTTYVLPIPNTSEE